MLKCKNDNGESTLSYCIQSRLDLPISKSLITRGFSSSIIERCYIDQYYLKNDDFIDGVDLLVVCTILQNHIKHIDDLKQHSIIPNGTISETRTSASTLNLCLTCTKEAKRLACIPCSQPKACISRGSSVHHSLITLTERLAKFFSLCYDTEIRMLTSMLHCSIVTNVFVLCINENNPNLHTPVKTRILDLFTMALLHKNN
ncbi:unnamed protein product [Rotaria socialis]|nr:unnamed protein product [Rotaria socialis]CAF3390829.1 unnamed protein product [Rotaria socialis]CAF3466335.1 unnamed protein product [Rotaria socialis]CAF3517040.1 unnamed protein product [Rotaria socialis]CAF4108328.1 unnamed protein product [Rotaria socialis]